MQTAINKAYLIELMGNEKFNYMVDFNFDKGNYGELLSPNYFRKLDYPYSLLHEKVTNDTINGMRITDKIFPQSVGDTKLTLCIDVLLQKMCIHIATTYFVRLNNRDLRQSYPEVFYDCVRNYLNLKEVIYDGKSLTKYQLIELLIKRLLEYKEFQEHGINTFDLLVVVLSYYK